jgi:hypothetical protein
VFAYTRAVGNAFFEYWATSVTTKRGRLPSGAGDDDLVARFQRLEMAEDAVDAVPREVSGEYCRPDLTRRRALGKPPDGCRAGGHLHSAVGLESEVDGLLRHTQRRDVDLDRLTRRQTSRGRRCR